MSLIKSLREESLHWLAETIRAASIGRMVAASLLGLVCQYKLSTTTAGLWLCSVLIGEIWLRRAAISLLRAPVETQGQRINFLLAFACGTLAWSSVGVLGWNIDGGAFQGTCMVVWMTQFMLAAVYAFRSRSGYIVATAAPMAAMLVAVVPTFTHMDASKAAGLIAGVLGPLIGYAMARHADEQREVLVATLSKLEQAAQSAALGASAKSEFLANMSHELRTPLTAILGFSELLQNSKSLTPEDSRSADRINTASRTLLTVVNDILDFSKMEAGALELEAQALDPVRLMQDALDVVAACAAAKGLGLRLEVTGAPVLVVGDPIRLRQVLFNLMNNALKFTSRGEIVGAVVFTPLGEEACRLRFEVRDTGIGIAEDKRSVMFERFSQADGSITRQYGGTGLGLAICKRIVTLMKGVIDMDSQLGQGSVFWLEVEAPIADHLAADSSPALSHATDGLDVRVLVAEDHPVNQELLRIILESAGVQVHVVGDGAQAVEAFQTGGFDLILMDVQMPVMDGPEATRRIRALEGDGARLPIIAMTANVMHHQISAYLAAGMDAHLGKPVDSIALIETVADWVDRSRLRVGAGEARAA